MKCLTAELPIFDGHREACLWFKERYGSNFIPKEYGTIGSDKIYIYHLILNQKHYDEGLKQLESSGVVSGLELAISYYIILIWEDGRVHIVY